MPRGYSKNKPSAGPLPPGNSDDLMARYGEGQRRMKRRRKQEPPELTSFDQEHLSLRCYHCDQIFNGPYRGKRVKQNSPEYLRIHDENVMLGGGEQGGISDRTCNKRSCVDKSADDLYAKLGRQYPEHDFTQSRQAYLEEEYQSRRDDTNTYPGGLIDDVEPSL